MQKKKKKTNTEPVNIVWRHTTNLALHRETRKTSYVAQLQFYTPCDNILEVLFIEISNN